MAISKISSIAIRAYRMEEMIAFYSEAFGGEFYEIDTRGFSCWFGDIAGVTLKLVPLREGTNFEDYPVHQPGFQVADVEAVIAVAIKHGGSQEGEIIRHNSELHAAVRDPDGNTIELTAEKN